MLSPQSYPQHLWIVEVIPRARVRRRITCRRPRWVSIPPTNREPLRQEAGELAGITYVLDELLNLGRRRGGQVADRYRHCEVEQRAYGADAFGRDAKQPVLRHILSPG